MTRAQGLKYSKINASGFYHLSLVRQMVLTTVDISFASPQRQRNKNMTLNIKLIISLQPNLQQGATSPFLSMPHLPERMQSHTGCIHLTFLHCVFSNVSSNGLPKQMQITLVAFV